MAFHDDTDFANLVHTVLTLDKKAAVKEVAPKIGLSADSLYARLNHRAKFSPEEIRDLIRAVPDVRLVNFFLDGSLFLPALRNQASDPADGEYESIQRTANLSVIEAAQVLEEVDRGLSDKKLDHQERARIMDEIAQTERALATLRTHLLHISGG